MFNYVSCNVSSLILLAAGGSLMSFWIWTWFRPHEACIYQIRTHWQLACRSVCLFESPWMCTWFIHLLKQTTFKAIEWESWSVCVWVGCTTINIAQAVSPMLWPPQDPHLWSICQTKKAVVVWAPTTCPRQRPLWASEGAIMIMITKRLWHPHHQLGASAT